MTSALVLFRHQTRLYLGEEISLCLHSLKIRVSIPAKPGADLEFRRANFTLTKSGVIWANSNFGLDALLSKAKLELVLNR